MLYILLLYILFFKTIFFPKFNFHWYGSKPASYSSSFLKSNLVILGAQKWIPTSILVSMNTCVQCHNLHPFYNLHFLPPLLPLMGVKGWIVHDKFSLIKSVTHILQRWNVAQLYLTQRRSKTYMNHVTQPLSSADISIFSPEISKFRYFKKYRYRLYFDT